MGREARVRKTRTVRFNNSKVLATAQELPEEADTQLRMAQLGLIVAGNMVTTDEDEPVRRITLR